MWPRADFLELLDITHPMVQAPMSGIAPAALAAAVSNAGGLGSIGCAGRPLAAVREDVAAFRQASNRPFSLNFFVHARPRIDPEATARMRAKLALYFQEFGLGAVPEPREPFPPFDAGALDLVLDLRPPGLGIAQSPHHGDDRHRTIGVSAARKPRRPTLAIAERGGARLLHAVLGGSGCFADAQLAGRSAGRKARRRSEIDNRGRGACWFRPRHFAITVDRSLRI
jgi:Nitronate monooxygenase